MFTTNKSIFIKKQHIKRINNYTKKHSYECIHTIYIISNQLKQPVVPVGKPLERYC